MSIQPLPTDLVSRIKSSAEIVSLNDAVIGMLCNSLDAGASEVDIDVDYSRGNCTVKDDGSGVMLTAMSPGSSLARLYHTSKHGEDCGESLHGFRGTFLASLGSMSIMQITSKTPSDPRRGSLLISYGDRLSMTAHQPLIFRTKSRSHGTTVTIQDIFGTMPVRVLQRPTGSQSLRVRSRMFQDLVLRLARIIMAWKVTVRVQLKGSDNNQKWLLNHGHETFESCDSTETFEAPFNAVQARLVLSRLNRVHYRQSRWIHTTARGDNMVVHGLFGKSPAPSKRLQFISINHLPIVRGEEMGHFYDVVDMIVASSNFGRNSQLQRDRLRYSLRGRQHRDHDLVSVSNEREDSLFSRFRKRHLVFYICITSHSTPLLRNFRLGILSVVQIDEIKTLLGAMVSEFIRDKSQAPEVWSSGVTTSPTHVSDLSTMNTQCQSSETNDQNVNDNKSRFSFHKHPQLDTLTSEDEEEARDFNHDQVVPEHVSNTRFYRRRAENPETMINGERNSFFVSDYGDSPLTHKSSEDISMYSSEVSEGSLQLPDSNQRSLVQLSNGCDCPLEGSGMTSRNSITEDEKTDTPLARISETERADSLYPSDVSCGFGTMQALGSDQVTWTETSIRPAQLREAQIIAQVDKKFILCITPNSVKTSDQSSIPKILFLIDQHAADERIRVELLLGELFQGFDVQPPQDGHAPGDLKCVTSSVFDEPIRFEIDDVERSLLHTEQDYFKHWGFVYHVQKPHSGRKVSSARRLSSNGLHGIMLVEEVPHMIKERCRTDPAELKRLLIDEALLRESRGLTGTFESKRTDRMSEMQSKANWTRRIRDCPQGLLDIINSRACRSAIMFNDYLSLDQCRLIIADLAETFLPFQCAHGRPTLIPLSSLAVPGREEFEQQNRQFANDWNAWVQEDSTDNFNQADRITFNDRQLH